jgi:transcriptional regulator with XRE-family HTH domain
MITPLSLPPPTSFGNRLRRARLVRGLSGSELVERCKQSIPTLNRSNYSRWEVGKNQPLMRNARCLAEVLRVNFGWLMYGEGPMEGPSSAAEEVGKAQPQPVVLHA